jgi:hypothetical protein
VETCRRAHDHGPQAQSKFDRCEMQSSAVKGRRNGNPGRGDEEQGPRSTTPPAAMIEAAANGWPAPTSPSWHSSSAGSNAPCAHRLLQRIQRPHKLLQFLGKCGCLPPQETRHSPPSANGNCWGSNRATISLDLIRVDDPKNEIVSGVSPGIAPRFLRR